MPRHVSNFVVVCERLKKQALKAVGNVEETFTEAAALAVENIIRGGRYSVGTPKDSGAAAYSWTVYHAGGRPKAFTDSPPDRHGDAAVEEALRVLRERKAGAGVRFGTRCPYMARLEFDGHSSQAPSGFIRTATAQWPAMVRSAHRKVQQRNKDRSALGTNLRKT